MNSILFSLYTLITSYITIFSLHLASTCYPTVFVLHLASICYPTIFILHLASMCAMLSTRRLVRIDLRGRRDNQNWRHLI